MRLYNVTPVWMVETIMIALLGYYRVQIKTSLATQFQYRVAMIIWMLSLVFEPIIYLVVWTTIARSNGGEISGYSTGDFAAYYLVMMMVMHSTQIWHMWEYEWYIRAGMFSARLLRPIHPIHQDASENLSFKLLTLSIVLILLFKPTLNPPLWVIFAFVPVLIAAAVLSFITGWAVTMAAFWTTRTMAINQMYFVAMFFFSGQIAPLSLLPSLFQTIAKVLPFRWILSFPVELLLGRLSTEETITGFFIQLIWIGVIGLLLRLIWRAAVRRYAAVGG
jgi:ABC-2 type transport system permease protein